MPKIFFQVSMQFAVLQAEIILKQHYSKFREEGIAFETFEDGQYIVPNKSLSSSRVLSNRIGDKRAFRGFWVRFLTEFRPEWRFYGFF